MTKSSVTAANYDIRINNGNIGPGNSVSIAIFNPGSLAITTDTTCSNASDANSGTTMSCSSAMTQGATTELLIGGLYEFSTATPTGTGGCAIPTNGTVSNSLGTAAICYGIETSLGGPWTPGFASMLASDAASIVGGLIK